MPESNVKIGFTGTRAGMTDSQWSSVTHLLQGHRGGYFHHGDCIGSDAQAHDSAYMLYYRITAHPSDLDDQRAYMVGCRVLPRKPALERNHDIVDATDFLIAAPKDHHEVRRSGTWSTIRYALRVGKPVTIVWPDGIIEERGQKESTVEIKD